ncbi:MAG: peptidase M14 [Clostridia bacterium]|nr:peptidase M14 [Clostridia bacterium]
MIQNSEYDYDKMVKKLLSLSENYESIDLSYIGNTVLGRKIPMVTMGDGNAKRGVLYVSTHHPMENICTSLMIRFIEEYAELIKQGKYAYGINTRVLYKMRRICIVPMLNPDGVEYRLHGIEATNPIKDRIVKYNGGEDFSDWNSNARGVDLNHNYNAYFDEYKMIERDSNITPGKTRYSGEAPESEPEVSALANYIRYNQEKIDGILSFHTQGEEIFFKSRGIEAPKSSFTAKQISKMTGYCVSEAEGLSSYGGLTDWFVKEYNKPSFTVECGKGKNPLSISCQSSIYVRIREMLYTFPILL